MADCSQFQRKVNGLKEALAECDVLDDPKQRAQCRARTQAKLDQAKEELKNCLAGLPPPGVQRAAGSISFLRVNEGGFGPPNDFLDSDVIVKLNTLPKQAFGIKLENPAQEGMLALLRDAFVENIRVTIDYRQVLNRFNSVAFRIELSR